MAWPAAATPALTAVGLHPSQAARVLRLRRVRPPTRPTARWLAPHRRAWPRRLAAWPIARTRPPHSRRRRYTSWRPPRFTRHRRWTRTAKARRYAALRSLASSYTERTRRPLCRRYRPRPTACCDRRPRLSPTWKGVRRRPIACRPTVARTWTVSSLVRASGRRNDKTSPPSLCAGTRAC